MDPWLEDPAVFGGLHSGIIFLMKEALQARLPEPYFVDSDDRVFVDFTERYIEPDVNVLRKETRQPEAGAATAVATRSAPIVIEPIPVLNEERRESFLNIYTRLGDDERLVTSIEVLSPSNKTSGEGMWAYRLKQTEVTLADVNLVEIDLLRGGQHVTIVPLVQLRAGAGEYDYHVCVSRADRRREAHVYPFRLPDRLPEIVVPLLPEQDGVALDLQPIFDRAYDAGPYRRRVNYAERQPVPPLRPDQAEWATQILREKGILPPS
jgi:hypothetical protein